MGGKNWDYYVNKVFVVYRKYYSKVDSHLVVIYTANCRTTIYLKKKIKKNYHGYVETGQNLCCQWFGVGQGKIVE